MTAYSRSHQERVVRAVSFKKPDRTPRDFAAVPEIWKGLAAHFGTGDRGDILGRLGVDCRVVSYDSFCRPPEGSHGPVDMEASQERSSVGGMWRRVEPDGSTLDIWGARRRKVANAYGHLDQLVSYALESAVSMEDLRRHPWPNPDWWDFSGLRRSIEDLNSAAGHSIRFRVGSVFETAWSLCNLEKFLVDLVMDPDRPMYVMERITEVHLANLLTVLETAGDLIDIVYYYDDLASQESLLMSPDMYDRFIRPFHEKIIGLAKRFGKHVMMHSCGAVYPLIPRFIDMGLDILNPVQPTARDMAPAKLAAEFGGRLVFHGGIDVQKFLPSATPAEVKAKVEETCGILGGKGGYIMSGSHHLQADTPIENVLAMYADPA